jgi:hypothetical protein
VNQTQSKGEQIPRHCRQGRILGIGLYSLRKYGVIPNRLLHHKISPRSIINKVFGFCSAISKGQKQRRNKVSETATTEKNICGPCVRASHFFTFWQSPNFNLQDPRAYKRPQHTHPHPFSQKNIQIAAASEQLESNSTHNNSFSTFPSYPSFVSIVSAR